MGGCPMRQLEYLRGLTVSEQTLLLLQLLDLFLVRRLTDQLVDIAQCSLSRDLEAGVLLPNAIPPNAQRRAVAIRRALCGARDRIGHIRRCRYPALTGLWRHRNSAGWRKAHAWSVGHGRNIDCAHWPHGAAGEGGRGIVLQVRVEVVVHGSRRT